MSDADDTRDILAEFAAKLAGGNTATTPEPAAPGLPAAQQESWEQRRERAELLHTNDPAMTQARTCAAVGVDIVTFRRWAKAGDWRTKRRLNLAAQTVERAAVREIARASAGPDTEEAVAAQQSHHSPAEQVQAAGPSGSVGGPLPVPVQSALTPAQPGDTLQALPEAYSYARYLERGERLRSRLATVVEAQIAVLEAKLAPQLEEMQDAREEGRDPEVVAFADPESVLKTIKALKELDEMTHRHTVARIRMRQTLGVLTDTPVDQLPERAEAFQVEASEPCTIVDAAARPATDDEDRS